MIPLHPAPHDFTDTCSNHLVCVCRTAKNQRLPFNGEPFLFACAAEGTNRVHLPRAGRHSAARRMRSIRENEKTPEEKARFLPRCFSFSLSPWKQKISSCLTGKLFADQSSNIREMGPGAMPLVRGYGGRRGPCPIHSPAKKYALPQLQQGIRIYLD